MMPTVDWHRQLGIGHGSARANTRLTTGKKNTMDATCKQNSNETSAAFETTVPQSTKENVPQKTKENVDQGMEHDSQLVGASHLVYKQLVLSKGYHYLGYKSPLTLALNLVAILIHLRILIEQS